MDDNRSRTTELELLQKKKKTTGVDAVCSDLKNEHTPSFLPLYFAHYPTPPTVELLRMRYEFEDFKRLSQ